MTKLLDRRQAAAAVPVLGLLVFLLCLQPADDPESVPTETDMVTVAPR